MGDAALVFADKNCQSSSEMVTEALGANKEFLDTVLQQAGVYSHEWKFYGATSGWSLQCKKDKKNLFCVQVAEGGFFVTIVLSRQAKIRALEEITHLKLKEAIIQAADHTDGTSVRILMNTQEDVSAMLQLLAIKYYFLK